ncbi:MAG: hypothetical protein WC413_02915 [Candidatus Nanoarchaeia archaeon]
MWQQILLYAFILISLFIFVKTSQIKVNGHNLISLKYRILLALFFPLVFVLLFLLSSVILALVLTAGFIILLTAILSRFYGKRLKLPSFKKKRKIYKVINK